MAEDFTQRATCKAYYKFENAADLGEDNQNQIDLTNNGVTQSADVPSGTYAAPSATKSGSFVSASLQYLNATHDASLLLDDITALTIVTWVKFTSSAADYILAYKSWYDADGWFLRITTTLEAIRAKFQASSYTEAAPSFSTATWYFIAMTYSQVSDYLYPYVGTEEALATLQGSGNNQVDQTSATASGMYLGRRGKNADMYLNGLLCETAFFTEQLSLAELQEIQADGMEGTPAVGNPWYYYEQQVGAAQ